jgi:hypothetical protein
MGKMKGCCTRRWIDGRIFIGDWKSVVPLADAGPTLQWYDEQEGSGQVMRTVWVGDHSFLIFSHPPRVLPLPLSVVDERRCIDLTWK